jgi:hypothetical protein
LSEIHNLDAREGNREGIAMSSSLNVDQMVIAISGVVVVVFILLGWYVHSAWLWVPLLLGLHMIQAAFTGWCPLAKALDGMGVRKGQCFS